MNTLPGSGLANVGISVSAYIESVRPLLGRATIVAEVSYSDTTPRGAYVIPLQYTLMHG